MWACHYFIRNSFQDFKQALEANDEKDQENDVEKLQKLWYKNEYSVKRIFDEFSM